MKRYLIAVLTLCAAPAAAQANANPAMGSVKPLWEQTTAYLLAAAEQMPEADYGFKPTPEVRSFGQLLGHVANAQTMICGAAMGEAPQQGGRNWEQVSEKAALIEGLRASNAVCARAHEQSDEAALQMVRIFGQERTRLSALVLNAAHNFEHYGNIVTYMRIKGMTPPSSQGN
jgi:uncharacterized damage-inducible protein DinB